MLYISYRNIVTIWIWAQGWRDFNIKCSGAVRTKMGHFGLFKLAHMSNFTALEAIPQNKPLGVISEIKVLLISLVILWISLRDLWQQIYRQCSLWYHHQFSASNIYLVHQCIIHCILHTCRCGQTCWISESIGTFMNTTVTLMTNWCIYYFPVVENTVTSYCIYLLVNGNHNCQ